MNDGEARIIDGLRNGDRLRIAIDRQQAPFFAQLREDQARVAAATKCAINIDTIRTNIQPINGFIQQYRSVFKIFHHLIETSPAAAPITFR